LKRRKVGKGRGREEVILKATWKTFERFLRVAVVLMREEGVRVRVGTRSVGAGG
jgi:hypothetical protein